MVAFARFVMRDNGLAIHINAEHVTQVRQTTEGEPAIYITGRDTPMIVEGVLEAAIRKLEAAAAGIMVIEPAIEAALEPTPPVAKSPVLELVTSEPPPDLVAEPESTPEPLPEPEVAELGKAKSSKAKTTAKSKSAKAKAPKTASEAPPKEPEMPYPSASWFRGSR